MSTANLDHHDLVNVTDNPGGPLVNEQLMQKLWIWDQFPRPFLDKCKSDSVGNRYVEWVEDEYGAPRAVAAVDGQDMTGNDATVGARKGNQCQIQYREVQVSTRADVSNSVGRQGSMSWQISAEQIRLKRDQEYVALSDQASVADDGNTTPGKTAGFFSQVSTNTVFGATGADGGWDEANKVFDAPTAGTAAALTEKDVKDILQACWQAGGNIESLIGTGPVARLMSEYYMSQASGNTAAVQTNQNMGENANKSNSAYTSVTVIISDFGQIVKIEPDRLMPQSTIAVPVADVSHLAFVDPRVLKASYLRGFVTEGLAKTGLSKHMMVTVDWALCLTSEKQCGAIRDIDETAAMLAVPA